MAWALLEVTPTKATTTTTTTAAAAATVTIVIACSRAVASAQSRRTPHPAAVRGQTTFFLGI